MNEKNAADQFVDYINDNIMPYIDYDKLQKSYSSDMVYAKGVLNSLHEAMVKVYGGKWLDEDCGDEGFVVIPGVVRGKETGNIAIALLDLDLSSSGEHWGTSILCKYGIVSQSGDVSDPGRQFMRSTIGSYDYCYTAEIHGDIHVNDMKLPKELKAILKDFHKYKADLLHPSDMLNEKDKKPSLLESVHEAEKETNDKSSQHPKENKSQNKKKKPEL